MNDFEFFLQDKLKSLKERRQNEEKELLDEKELLSLLLMELSYGELFVTIKKFPDADINPIIEKTIYIEARRRGYTPEDALQEMKRQMVERGLKG